MTMPRSLLFVVLEGTGRQDEAAVAHTGKQTNQSCIPEGQRRHNDRTDGPSPLLRPSNKVVGIQKYFISQVHKNGRADLRTCEFAAIV